MKTCFKAPIKRSSITIKSFCCAGAGVDNMFYSVSQSVSKTNTQTCSYHKLSKKSPKKISVLSYCGSKDGPARKSLCRYSSMKYHSI